MRFELIFQLHPASQFGLPEEGVTVLPAGTTTKATSPIVHARAGVQAGHGTLSKYRDDDEQLEVSMELGPSVVRLVDNYAFIAAEAATSNEAFDLAFNTLERFLRHLCLNQGVAFSFTPLVIEDEHRRLYRIPQQMQLGRWVIFNLGQLEGAIKEAELSYPLSDERLDRALEYYEHATFLYSRRQDFAPLNSPHFRLLIASVFLSLWKAVSAVIGDPSRDTDYRHRYRTLDLEDDFFQTRIEPIRRLRNDYDVAHYTLDAGRLAQIEREFGQSQLTAREIIVRYRSRLNESP